MVRLQKTITLLLPVFWLVTLSYAQFESTACARSADCAAVSGSSDHATPVSGDGCCYAHDQLHHAARRHLADRPEDELLRPGLPAGNCADEPPASIAAISPTGGAFLLQQRWQFLWRTADSPRAPNLLA